jgi:hypothetical protein
MRTHTQQMRSPMTRKPAPRAQAHSGVALFIATITILIALVTFAPLTGVGQPSGQSPHPGNRLQPKGPVNASSQPSSPLFLPAVTYPSGGQFAASVAVADLNGDGKLDVVVANANSNTVGVLLGNGDGTFQAPVIYAAGGRVPVAVVVADVNADGRPDLVLANICASASNCAIGVIGVLLGNGDGTFQRAVTYGSGVQLSSVAVADLNGDGRLDIVATNKGDNTLGVLLGRGDGTFQSAVSYGSGSNGFTWSTAVADVNGDGRPDLIVAADCINYPTCTSGAVGVLLGNGDGTFQAAVTYSSGGESGPRPEATSVAVADVNGDGKPDLLVGNGFSGTVGVLLGNGDGTFQTAVNYNIGFTPIRSVALADVNGDGRPDLLVGGDIYIGTVQHGQVGYLLGNGDGTFQPIVTFGSGGNAATSIAPADVNGDGQPDLLAANAEGNTVGVLLHNGASQSSTNTTLVSSLNPSFVGQAVTFTATVTSPAGTPPNGEIVTFKNGSAVLGTAPLSAGTASLTTSSLPVGTFTITASYGGDATFAASTSLALKQVVNPTSKFATSTSLTSSLNPSIYGQAVTWRATVTSSGSVTPTGTVKFTWSGYRIGAATLNSSGIATLTKANLNADAYPLVALYSGDAANLGSTSAVLNQVVQETTSAATLSSSPNPSTQGQAVTFTAKITSPTVTPTGPVTFTAGKTLLGTAQLSGGKAQLTIPSLPVGSAKVTVTYYGDSNIAKSSAAVTQTVH